MSTRTTYTSTIRVPIYASWACPKCKEVNFSSGVIACRRSDSSTSLSSSKQEAARISASNLAQRAWKENAFGIMFDPRRHSKEVLTDLSLQNSKCTKCGCKPQWDKKEGNIALLMLLTFGAIIGLGAVISNPKSIISWCILALCIGGITFTIVKESLDRKAIAKTPDQYVPIIGSLNNELIEYAKTRGKTIPTPEEAIVKVKEIIEPEELSTDINDGMERVSSSDLNGDSDAESGLTREKTGETTSYFCRKCGTQIPEGCEFCHKCGTKIVL